MTEHLTQEYIDRYQERALSPTELLALDDHLAVCEECRSGLALALGVDEKAARLYRALHDSAEPGLEHLDFDQLEGYADEILSGEEREDAERHLEICSRCKGDIQDLRAVRVRIPAASTRVSTASVRPSWREVVLRLWSTRLALAAQAALVVVTVALLVVTIRLQTTITTLQAQVAHATLQTRQLDVARAENDTLRGRIAQLTEENGRTVAMNRDVTLRYQAASANAIRLKRQLSDAINLHRAQSTSDISDPLLTLNDGIGQVRVASQVQIKAAARPVPLSRDLERDIAVELSQEHFTPPLALDGLTVNPLKLMGLPAGGVSFLLNKPVGVVSETDRPTFRWHALPHASAYQVTVMDKPDIRFPPVVQSRWLTQTTWKPQSRLTSGVVYYWHVTALLAGNQATSPPLSTIQAQFKVLDPVKRRELEQQKRKYGRSHLALATLYLKAGMLEEAEQEWKAVVAANPHSAAARRVLNNVEALRRRLGDAE